MSVRIITDNRFIRLMSTLLDVVIFFCSIHCHVYGIFSSIPSLLTVTQKRPHKHSVLEGGFYDHAYSLTG
jgi:hypothetical protein